MKPYLRQQPSLQRYHIIDTPAKLEKLAERMMNITSFAFDTETGSYRANRNDGLAVRGDTEYTMCVCITISWSDVDNYYIPIHHRREEDVHRNLVEELVVEKLQPVFDRDDITVVGFNLNFDKHVLTRMGFTFRQNLREFDVQLALWLVDENLPKNLKGYTNHYLKIPQEHFAEVIQTVPSSVKKEFGLKASNVATYDLVLIEDGKDYALDDSFYTWNLYLFALDAIEQEGMQDIFWKHSMPFSKVLYKMEERGVTVDIQRLEEMKQEIEEDLEELLYKMTEILGCEFNPKSNDQLSQILFDYVKSNKKDARLDCVSFAFPIQSNTPSGAPQTNALTLWKLSNLKYKSKQKLAGVEFVKLLMQYKKLEKLKSAFIDGLQTQIYADGKVHCSFNQTGADSGRLSCSTPNLQQLPRAGGDDDKYQIRSLFIGSLMPNGERKKIIACDFSNLEVRVTAHFSKDERLLEMFAAGEDIHGATAVSMFELDCKPKEAKKKYPHLRQVAKTLNFMLIYGGGAPTLYNNLLNDTQMPIDLGDKEHLKQYNCKNGIEVAQIYIDKYFEAYKGVAKFMRRQKLNAHRDGFVCTILKRKRRLNDINSSDYKMKSYNERLALNAPIQGTAADITSSAQIRIDADRWFEEHGCLMLIQVHDELVFECPEEYVEEATKRIQHYFRYPFGDDYEFLPTLESEADFGNSYAEAK